MAKFMNNLFLFFVLMVSMFSLAIIGLLGWQKYQGNLTGADLNAFVEVLVGKKRYAISKIDIEELAKFRAAAAKLKGESEKRGGSLQTQIISANALRTRQTIVEQNFNSLQARLREKKLALDRLRAQIEAIKVESVKKQARLVNLKKQTTQEELKKDQARVKKIFQGMEPDDIAKYLLTRRPEEAARNLKLLMDPGLVAEVMTEMAATNRPQSEKILPLLENEYAGWNAETIVSEWTNKSSKNYKEPEVMIEYIKRMNPIQAFKVYFALPPEIRKKVRTELARDLRPARR